MITFKAAHERWIDVFEDGVKIGAVAGNLRMAHPVWRAWSRKIGVGWHGFSTQTFPNALAATKYLVNL